MQKQYVEKPVKILGEQYLAAATPPAVGVCVQDDTGMLIPAGVPHVHTELGPKALHETDMIVSSRWKVGVYLDVLPLAEFEERYGNVPDQPPAE